MRNIVVTALVSGVTFAATAALPAYDGFGNGPRANLGGSTGGTGWTSAWIDNGSATITSIAGAGLTFPGLATTPGAAVTAAPAGSFEMTDYQRAFGPVPGDTLFVSFLYRPDAAYQTFGGLAFGYYPTGVFVGSPLGYYSYGFLVGDGLIVVSNVPEIVGQTVFLVVEIHRNAATGRTTYALYIDPTPGAPKPAYPAVQTSVPGLTLPTSLRISNDGGVTTDEIRVGATWADVTPVPTCPGDLNQDRSVNLSDLAVLLAHYGMPTGAQPGDGDLDADGDVDLQDLAGLLANFGSSC